MAFNVQRGFGFCLSTSLSGNCFALIYIELVNP
jgi:hypothetical protein